MVYRGASEDERIIQRPLAGCTQGLLQASASQYKYKCWTVDFLHRTVFDWLRKKDNWTTICSHSPPDFNPILTLIAILASHLRESIQPASIVARTPRGLELRKQLTFRILKLSSEVENTPENRGKLVTILDQMATE